MSNLRWPCVPLVCLLGAGCAAGVTGGRRAEWSIPPALAVGTASWLVAGVIAGEPSNRLAATSPAALAAGVAGAAAGTAAGYYLMPDDAKGHGFSAGLPLSGATLGAGLAFLAAIRFVRGSGGGPELAEGAGPKIRRDMYLGAAAGLVLGSGAAILIGRVRAGRQDGGSTAASAAAGTALSVGPAGLSVSGQF
ncbi:MAG: hypothetical protein KBG28_01040 [Kofleriaceae bacterium]|nr:hypothetical protein [Kofleriaceae bacterium]